jgi:hypothetical protein
MVEMLVTCGSNASSCICWVNKAEAADWHPANLVVRPTDKGMTNADTCYMESYI